MVYINGKILPEHEARISPLERGYLYGIGLFETMRAYNGRIHLRDRHLARLAEGAAFLGLQIPPSSQLADALTETIAANGEGDARVRLTVSDAATVNDASIKITSLITVQPIQSEPVPLHYHSCIISTVRRQVPEIGVMLKSLNYLASSIALREVANAKAGEAILLSPNGYVAEGAISNIFCVRQGVLYTPPLSLGILPGITRARVMELATAHNIEICEEQFPLDSLLAADECFYTNSVRELVPVFRIEETKISNGTPGEMSSILAEAYRSETPSQTL